MCSYKVMSILRDAESKRQTVLQENTFYFYDPHFEDTYEVQLVDSLRTRLHNLETQIRINGFSKSIFDNLLQQPSGIDTLLTLNGLSFEQLKRIFTYARIVQESTLDALLRREQWLVKDNSQEIIEWNSDLLRKYIVRDAALREGIINLFFEGAANQELARILPPFELRKLDIRKMQFSLDGMIDTLVRYKVRGSRSSKKMNNAENVLQKLLKQLKIPYTSGDLPYLVDQEQSIKRTMDFIIPNKQHPKVIIESSYMMTTSSSQGDKAKSEIGVRSKIKRYYPDAFFVGFVDGIGWYVRPGDLLRMVDAYDEVFTFSSNELSRFEKWITSLMRASNDD